MKIKKIDFRKLQKKFKFRSMIYLQRKIRIIEILKFTYIFPACIL